MKYSKIFLSITLSLCALQNGNAQNIGIGTTTPDTNAILHLESASKGILLPRLTNKAMNDIINPAIGLAVFNTDSNGMFVFTDTAWHKLLVPSDISNSDMWSMSGNNGTTSANFIGTTDSATLLFKANNQAAGFIGLSNTNRTAFGYKALLNDAALNNSAFGFEALQNNTAGTGNTAVGNRALAINNGGMSNTALGSAALQNSNGSNNTAAGFSALTSSTTGNVNSAFGTYALANNNVGTENEAFGYGAMVNNTAACGNVAVGNLAMYSQSFNNSNFIWLTMNTGVGFHAMYSNQPTSTFNGNRNTALGANAMFSNTVGSNNTNIGAFANVGSGALSNATSIGANAIVNTSNSLVLGNNANVGIGTSSPAYKLHVLNMSTNTEALIESETENANISAAAKTGKQANLNFYNYVSAASKLNRWQIGKSNDAESGANQGSNFTIKRFSDAGAVIDEPLQINRDNGLVSMNTTKLHNLQLAITTASSSYTITNSDQVVFYNGATIGDTITLPSSPEVGRVINIINHAAHAVQVAPDFEIGNATLVSTIAAAERFQLIYTGSVWVLLQ